MNQEAYALSGPETRMVDCTSLEIDVRKIITEVVDMSIIHEGKGSKIK